jgi:hypothetical protein
MVGKAIQLSCFASYHLKQFKTFTLDPLIRDKLTCSRITIEHLRPIVVAFVPVLAYGTFSGAEGHDTCGFELDFISRHDSGLPNAIAFRHPDHAVLLFKSINGITFVYTVGCHRMCPTGNVKVIIFHG